MTLDEELQRIPELTNIGRALVDFTMSLTDGHFVREGKSWVYRPPNFVTLSVQHARAQNIALSLYGNWHSIERSPLLPIYAGRNYMWVRCTIDSPRQLAAACRYIEQAFMLHAESPRQNWKREKNAAESPPNHAVQLPSSERKNRVSG